jgi:two-component system sensor histidine kinase RstB
MFIRIYVTLLLSSIFAAIVCYGFYQWQHDYRLQQHTHALFNGNMALIADGINRHTGTRQKKWIEVAQKLIAADISVQRTITDKNINQPLKSEILASGALRLTYQSENIQLTTVIKEISEQHYRLMAILLSNELGRVASSDWQQTLQQNLTQQFKLPLSIVDLSHVELDAQQISRLKRFDIVVAEKNLGRPSKLVFSRLPKSDQVLRIGPIKDFEKANVTAIIFILILAILITGTVAYILVRQLERRLSSIKKGVSRFSANPVHLTLQDKHQDAIGQLAESVNGMSLQIHQLLSDQKQILRAISHELRTPLSRLKFRLEILSGEILTESASSNLQGIRNDIIEMDTLITEAVSFNQGTYQLQPALFKLEDIINEIINKLKIEHQMVEVTLEIDQHSEVIQDKTLTTRLLQNLIQNAFKYGQGKVSVRLVNLPENICIYIDDNGPGIPTSRRQSVFSPFTRLDTSRNKQTGGLGLGLAIVKNICEVSSFEIHLSDSEFGGASFELFIPTKDIK